MVGSGQISLDRDGELGEVAVPDDAPERRSASSIPAAVQRRHISPERQRLTLRLVRRTHSIIDSQGLVEASVVFSTSASELAKTPPPPTALL